MKKTLLLIILVCAVALTTAASQKKRTVMDYYLALPDEVFYCEIRPKDLSTDFKKKQVIRADIRNGYIQARSESYVLEVALFTDARTATTVVAVNRPCGAGCMCDYFRLMVPTLRGKWYDFDKFPSSDEIMKVAGIDEPLYELVLPEKGTDIRVIHQDTKKNLARISWTGGRFVLRKK